MKCILYSKITSPIEINVSSAYSLHLYKFTLTQFKGKGSTLFRFKIFQRNATLVSSIQKELIFRASYNSGVAAKLLNAIWMRVWMIRVGVPHLTTNSSVQQIVVVRTKYLYSTYRGTYNITHHWLTYNSW